MRKDTAAKGETDGAWNSRAARVGATADTSRNTAETYVTQPSLLAYHPKPPRQPATLAPAITHWV